MVDFRWMEVSHMTHLYDFYLDFFLKCMQCVEVPALGRSSTIHIALADSVLGGYSNSPELEDILLRGEAF